MAYAYLLRMGKTQGACITQSGLDDVVSAPRGRSSRAGALTSPPGLLATSGLPVDDMLLERPFAAPATQGYEVVIQGLPSNMLSDLMVDCILDQAGLQDAVTGFRCDRATGQLFVNLATGSAVQQCLGHFRGSKWSSGHSVRAYVVDAAVRDAAQSTSSVELPSYVQSTLASVSPGFVPGTTWSRSFCPDTPAFIDFGKRWPLSEQSTDAGDSSEADDETLGVLYRCG